MNESTEKAITDHQWFKFSPRECDLLYALWSGVDLWQAGQKLGISRTAFLYITSKESVKNELEKFYQTMTMSPNERSARLSELARGGWTESK